MENWERRYTRDGCPYYTHHRTRKSQWEHPYFAQIITDLEDYNDVIYAAYRAALKLLHLRNNLHLQSLRVEKLASAFDSAVSTRGIRSHESMTFKKLDELADHLYVFCETSLSQRVWTEAITSCLLHFFDSKRRGTVNTLSALIFLTFLCSDKLLVKYTFLFRCLSKHDLVSSSDIAHLKKIVFTLLGRIKEERPFKSSYEGYGTTMTKEMFLKWVFTEPKFVVWLSTLHRIHAAISVRHEAKCYVCREYPINGLRYRCLQCFKVDMCFQCFTRVPTYGKHDKSHSIEEYCVPSKKMQDIKAFLTKCRNHIKRKRKSQKSSSAYESDITSARQPVTVYHDPRMSSDANFTPSDVEPNRDRSLSPIGRSNSSRARSLSPRIAANTHNGISLQTGGQLRTPNSNGAESSSQACSRPKRATIYTDSARYCQSLPRRPVTPNHTSSHIDFPPLSMLSQLTPTHSRTLARPSRSSLVDPTSPPRNRLPATQELVRSPQRAPREGVSAPLERSKVSYVTEYEYPANCSTRLKYHSGRELYGPTAVRPRRHSRDLAPVGSSYLSKGQTRPRAVSSEDEGVVLNSESDSGCSQYGKYPQNVSGSGEDSLDHTKYTLDRSLNTTATSSVQNTIGADFSLNCNWPYGAADCSLLSNSYIARIPNQRSYQHTTISQNDANTSVYPGLYKPLDGVQEALPPMVQRWQV